MMEGLEQHQGALAARSVCDLSVTIAQAMCMHQLDASLRLAEAGVVASRGLLLLRVMHGECEITETATSTETGETHHTGAPGPIATVDS